MTVRMNWGCGSTQPDDWVNVDKEIIWTEQERWRRFENVDPEPGLYWLDIRDGCTSEEPEIYPGGLPDAWSETFDYVVAHCSISDLDHHELGPALKELHRVLRPGGVLRVSVPDLELAMRAWENFDDYWFPQGDDLSDLSERFCTFVTWFGTVKSVFTWHYLQLVLDRAGFSATLHAPFGVTILCNDTEITSLDGDKHRARTCIYVEAVK